jgi:hypothetical protein
LLLVHAAELVLRYLGNQPQDLLGENGVERENL